MINKRAVRATILRSAKRAGVDLIAVRRRLRLIERRLRGSRSAEANWYDSVYEARPGVYTDHYSESPYFPLWRVISSLVPAEASVLEIGCGTGQLAELLRDSGIRHYTGFDFSSAAVGLARERLPDMQFHVADARKSPLLLIEVDVVVCTEVLEHITEDIEVIERIPSGTRLIATVPDFDSETHVRWFPSATQVERRYGTLFSSLTVTEHVLNLEKGRFFLLDGLRAG